MQLSCQSSSRAVFSTARHHDRFQQDGGEGAKAERKTTAELTPPLKGEGNPKCVDGGGPCVVGMRASAGGLEAFEQFFSPDSRRCH